MSLQFRRLRKMLFWQCSAFSMCVWVELQYKLQLHNYNYAARMQHKTLNNIPNLIITFYIGLNTLKALHMMGWYNRRRASSTPLCFFCLWKYSKTLKNSRYMNFRIAFNQMHADVSIKVPQRVLYWIQRADQTKTTPKTKGKEKKKR